MGRLKSDDQRFVCDACGFEKEGRQQCKTYSGIFIDRKRMLGRGAFSYEVRMICNKCCPCATVSWKEFTLEFMKLVFEEQRNMDRREIK